MNKFKFVYFDLGGVAIMDFSGTDKWLQLKKELGIDSKKEKQFDDLFKESELSLGKTDTETLLALMKKNLGTRVPDNYSLLIDGFVNRFEANKSIWPVIEKIHKDSKVGLLTNVYPGMLDAIKNRGILPDIDWDVILDSSIIGLRKPDPKIFQLAQDKAKARGAEILFVDNTLENIRVAEESAGWQTFLYDSSNAEDSSRKLAELF